MSRIPTAAAPLALAIGFTLAALPAALQAQAAAASTVHAIQVPAQPLASALAALARQTGTTLVAAPELVAGKTAPALAGHLMVQQAYERLLAGSGLGVSIDGRAVVVRAAARNASELPAITVTAAAPISGASPAPAYAGGQVARGARLGMLGTADVFETPFSIKAYTAETIRDQGARSVNDALANDPSIRATLSATSPLDQSSIRGFQGNSDTYLFDGLQGLFAYSTIPVQHYERLEVLKGPAAALMGASGLGGTVGGSFNLVPKRATDLPVRSVTLYATDQSLVGTHVDIGQRFGPDQRFGARLNLSAEDGRLYDDAKRRLVAPQIALDWRGERTRLTLDAGVLRRQSSPLFNHWLLQAGAALPAVPDPRHHAKPSWERLDLRQTFGVLSGEWDLNEQWTAYARHGRLKEEPPQRLYIDQSTIDGAGRVRYSSATSLIWTQANEVNDLGLRGRVRWGETEHKLAFGIVHQRQQLQDLRSQTRQLATPVNGSIYTANEVPNPFAGGIPTISGVDNAPVRLHSFALADTVSMLDDRLIVLLAARHQSFRNGEYDQSKLTPTAAALLKLGHGVSIYGNYAQTLAQGAIAPAGSSNASKQLAPYLSRQHELGLKWDRGNHGLTLAYFEIQRASAFVDSDNVFRTAGRQRNRGVELETFGELGRGLRVLGGVAWIDGRMTRTARGAFDGRKAIGVPELTANLGAELDVATLPGLTLTGRFIHTGSAFVDLANTQKVPSWRRVDVGARYAWHSGPTRVTLRAGIQNLLDDHSWTIAGRNFISVAPPRTWQLSASFDF